MKKVVGRMSTPEKVHKLWDAISDIQGHKAGVEVERLVTSLTGIHYIRDDNMITQLDYAIDDNLLQAEYVDPGDTDWDRELPYMLYKLPETENFIKGDHDWYCFKCQFTSGTTTASLIKCNKCPRVYHRQCLDPKLRAEIIRIDQGGEDKEFVCPACTTIAEGEANAKEGPLSKDKINQLINQIISERFGSWHVGPLGESSGDSYAYATEDDYFQDSPVLPSFEVSPHVSPHCDAWRYKLLVYFQMDLETMQKKSEDKEYNSLEEFLVDCETLIHSVKIYFMKQSNWIQAGSTFLRSVKESVEEIKLCSDCFEKYMKSSISKQREENEGDWFLLPCSTQHEIGYVKLLSSGEYWPAKILARKEACRVAVRFFGKSHELLTIYASEILPVTQHLKGNKKRLKKADWKYAYLQMKEYLRRTKDPSNCFENADETEKASTSGYSSTNTTEVTFEEIGPNGCIDNPSGSTPEESKASGGTSKKKKVKNAYSSMPTLERFDANDGAFASESSSVEDKEKLSQPSKRTRTETETSKDVSDVATNTTEGTDEEIVELFLKGDLSFSPKLSQMQKAIQEQIQKLESVHVENLRSIKKKQWCCVCQNEAIGLCCWNTSYCSKACQDFHWEKGGHQIVCTRDKFKVDESG